MIQVAQKLSQNHHADNHLPCKSLHCFLSYHKAFLVHIKLCFLGVPMYVKFKLKEAPHSGYRMFAWRDLEKMYLFHMLQVQRAFRVAVILHDATMYYSIGRNIPWSSTNQRWSF